MSKYNLNRLYRYDGDIFSKQVDGQENPYSRKCGAVATRQPLVITDKEKEEIDAKHPNSYHKESAIRFGSTEENQNWYICPLYWCIRCNTSLTDKELVKTNGKCPECEGTIIKKEVKHYQMKQY